MHRASNIQIVRVRYTGSPAGSPALPVEVSFHYTRAPDRGGDFQLKTCVFVISQEGVGGAQISAAAQFTSYSIMAEQATLSGVCTASPPSEVALNVHVCYTERNE